MRNQFWNGILDGWKVRSRDSRCFTHITYHIYVWVFNISFGTRVGPGVTKTKWPHLLEDPVGLPQGHHPSFSFSTVCTVDGCEILHQLKTVVNVPIFLSGLKNHPKLVVQDILHPQYVTAVWFLVETQCFLQNIVPPFPSFFFDIHVCWLRDHVALCNLVIRL